MNVFAFPASGPYPDPFYRELEKLGVRVTEGEFSLAGLWRAKRGDIVHMHWPSYLYAMGMTRLRMLGNALRFVLLLCLLRLRGCRVVWTAHNLYPHEPTPVPYVDVTARRLVVRLAELVLVHGPTAQSILAREFPCSVGKTVQITHGHWVGQYAGHHDAQSSRLSFGIAAESYVYLFFGMCRRYKNLAFLIETFATMPSDCELIIAGKFQASAYRTEIKAMVEHLGNDRIRLIPEHIPDEDVQRYFAAANAVVLPYRDTLTSGGAVLAMSQGVPVVAPKKGFLSDLVEPHCGELYDLESQYGLRQAMTRIRAREFSAADIIESVSKHRWSDAAGAMFNALHSKR